MRENRIIFASIFFALLVFLYAQHLLLIDQNDDLTVWNLLRDGEYRTLLLSIPLSCVLVYLYHYLPAMPWYSITLMIFFVASFWMAMTFADLFRTRILQLGSSVFVLIFYIFFAMNLSVTSVTVLLFVTNLLNLGRNVRLFWIMTGLSLLLRTEIVLGLLPLALLMMFYLSSRGEFQFMQKANRYALFPVIVYLLNAVPIMMDSEYSHWLDFNKARAYFIDFSGENTTLLSGFQSGAIGVWWIVDEEMLPTSKVIAAAGNIWTLLAERLRHPQVPAFLGLFFLASLLIVYYAKNRRRALFFLLILSGYLLLLVNLRDVDRVMIPVMLFAVMFVMYFIDEAKAKSKMAGIALLTFLITLWMPKTYMEFQENKLVNKRKHNYSVELQALMAANHSRIAIPVVFPVYFINLHEVLNYNGVFDETAWIQWSQAHFYPEGWLARHPYFYKLHNISHDGTKRRFANFYEFMMDDNTTFLGGNSTNPGLERTQRILLNYYDRTKAHKGCVHEIVEVNSTLNFKLVKLSKICH